MDTQLIRTVSTALLATTIVLIGTPAIAGFALQPPVSVSTARFPQIAASADGQVILISWHELDTINFRRSVDGGASFEPIGIVAEAPIVPIDGLWADAEIGTAPVVAADGTTSHVMAGIEFQTDPFFPPPGLPPALRLSSMRLYGSTGAGFGLDQRVTTVHDACFLAGGLTCASLRDFDLAANDTATRFVTAFNVFALDGREGETLVAYSDAGDRRFSRAINLSALLLPTQDGNDFSPRITMDGTGQKVFISWTDVPVEGNVSERIARSTDGGRSWALLDSVGEGSNQSDLGYARDAGVLVWGYQTGFYFNPDEPSVIALRLSADDGVTLSPAVVAAVKQDLGGGDTMQVNGPVRLAMSRDGQTIAVLHSEELCTAVFGCLGGSVTPFDVVLSVSEDAGASYQRVGVVAQSFFAAYDLAIAADGASVSVASDTTAGSTILVRANRE